jgi:ABC-type glutathione transport system ATPase component
MEAEAEDREARVDGTTAAVQGIATEKTDLDKEGTSTPVDVQPMQLRDISLKIPRGQLCAIVGPVGAGKSALLHALIGEMKRLSGSVKFGASSCRDLARARELTILMHRRVHWLLRTAGVDPERDRSGEHPLRPPFRPGSLHPGYSGCMPRSRPRHAAVWRSDGAPARGLSRSAS